MPANADDAGIARTITGTEPPTKHRARQTPHASRRFSHMDDSLHEKEVRWEVAHGSVPAI